MAPQFAPRASLMVRLYDSWTTVLLVQRSQLHEVSEYIRGVCTPATRAAGGRGGARGELKSMEWTYQRKQADINCRSETRHRFPFATRPQTLLPPPWHGLPELQHGQITRCIHYQACWQNKKRFEIAGILSNQDPAPSGPQVANSRAAYLHHMRQHIRLG
jgi:hypothetical protein